MHDMPEQQAQQHSFLTMMHACRQDAILLGRQLAPPTQPQHPPALRAKEPPKSQSSHHLSSHKRRGPERERERDRAFKRPRGEGKSDFCMYTGWPRP